MGELDSAMEFMEYLLLPLDLTPASVSVWTNQSVWRQAEISKAVEDIRRKHTV